MIFVTVGNANQGFERLLQTVERLVAEGFIANDVLVQAGNNPDFRPLHCKVVSFLPLAEFERCVSEAQTIISHAGAGTLIHVLKAGKIPVVMPRRKKYDEHVDDHQMEIVEVLAAEGRLIPAYEPEDLPTAIAEANRRSAQQPPPTPVRMIELVSQAIEELLTLRPAANRPIRAVFPSEREMPAENIQKPD